MEELPRTTAAADESGDNPPAGATGVSADRSASGALQSAGESAARAEVLATVEAILFASDSPLTPGRIAAAAELPVSAVNRAVRALNERYERAGSAFGIEAIAGGFQMLTRPEYNDVLSRLLRARSDSRLSQAALETLAIVAYRQPIMRADIEAIRGVACGEVLRGLLDKGLVKIVGRAEVLGRPMLYGTTRRFLEAFGLASLDDLPRVEELRTGAPPPAAGEPPTVKSPPDERTEQEDRPSEPPPSGAPPAASAGGDRADPHEKHGPPADTADEDDEMDREDPDEDELDEDELDEDDFDQADEGHQDEQGAT